MNDKNIKPGALVEGTQDSPNAEMQHLLAQMDDIQIRPRHQHGSPQKQGEGSDC